MVPKTLTISVLMLLVMLQGAVATDFLGKVLSKDKVPDNSVCDDGEYVFIDSDCKLDQNALSSVWLIRLVLVLLIFSLVKSSKYTSGLVIAFVALFAYNNGMGAMTSEPVTQQNICNVTHLGNCLFPSNPFIGWILILAIIYIIFRVNKQ